MPGKLGHELVEKSEVPAGGISPAIKRATLLPLVAITYCMVAGGPYGLEDLVSSAGYRNAVLLLITNDYSFPWPWRELAGAWRGQRRDQLRTGRRATFQHPAQH